MAEVTTDRMTLIASTADVRDVKERIMTCTGSEGLRLHVYQHTARTLNIRFTNSLDSTCVEALGNDYKGLDSLLTTFISICDCAYFSDIRKSEFRHLWNALKDEYRNGNRLCRPQGDMITTLQRQRRLEMLQDITQKKELRTLEKDLSITQPMLYSIMWGDGDYWFDPHTKVRSEIATLPDAYLQQLLSWLITKRYYLYWSACAHTNETYVTLDRWLAQQPLVQGLVRAVAGRNITFEDDVYSYLYDYFFNPFLYRQSERKLVENKEQQLLAMRNYAAHLEDTDAVQRFGKTRRVIDIGE